MLEKYTGMDKIEGIKWYCEKVRKRFSSRAIILIGSYARGDFYDDSDIDLIIISDELPEQIMDRIYILIKMNDSSIPIEPHGFKTDEFMGMIRELNIMALDTIYEGKVVYDDGFIDDAKRNMRKL
jgi:Nucleotidyltransferase domain.